MKILRQPSFLNKVQTMDWLLFAAAFVLLFCFLGARGLWAAEGRWAQVTREMFLTHDFFHPTIGGEPYFDKPLLTYWLIALISVITGSLTELTIRLPSALSGIVAIWAVLRLGTTLWSVQVGRMAAWMLLTCYSFLFWSRTGTADAENLAVTVLAVLWYIRRRDRINFWTFLVFYLIGFTGALTKGLTAVVIPVLLILPDVLKQKRWLSLLKPAHFAALALGVCVYLSPFILASMTRPDYQSSGLALVFQENIQRFFQPIDHKGAIYLYVYALPQLLLPWTPVCVVAMIAFIKHWRDLDDKTQWLIQAIGLVFLFFTLSGSRRSYYILPLIPFCLLLAAKFLSEGLSPRITQARQWISGIQVKIAIGLIVFELLLPILLVILKSQLKLEVPLAFYVVTLAGALAAGAIGLLLYYWHGQAQNRGIFATIGITTVLLGVYFGPQQMTLEANRTERPFTRLLAKRIAEQPASQVATFPKINANVLFYLDMKKPILIIDDPVALKAFINETPNAVLISKQYYIDRIPSETSISLQGYHRLSEPIHPWENKSSHGRDKWVAWFEQAAPEGIYGEN